MTFLRDYVEEAQNIEEAIIEMTQKRPLTITDIANVPGISEANAEKWANGLKESGNLKNGNIRGNNITRYAAEK